MLLINNLIFYPNPANDEVTFITAENSSGIVLITDLTGRLLAETRTTGPKTIWQINKNLTNGIYPFKYISDSKIQSGKLILHRF